MPRSDIRFALPSKGRLEAEAVDFLAACGLRLHKPNPRQYQASLPALPGVTVLFQRPGDIVVGVREGSIDFGLTGLDVIEERRGDDGEIMLLHDGLNFGHCALTLAVPEEWPVYSATDLQAYKPQPLRIATKYPRLTARFLRDHGLTDFTLIDAEGTLEVAPAIGYADLIADLVSSGQTLHDNRLRPLPDGVILRSQAALIANRAALKARPEVLGIARTLLEMMEAHLRAEEHYMVTANVRDSAPERIARNLFAHPDLGGLQGPTIAPVHTRSGELWHAIQIVVRQDHLLSAVNALRSIGGSGVIVSPVTYIFEEEPERSRRLNENL